ncbi:MAG TPA: histidine phosphatase family protein [Ktedonobacterales bacterium]|nr:histidine phosphatase family protein [Ktedonobacterales bacterium]
MRLYILRHGRAGDRETWQGDDQSRPLTDEGRERTVAAARGLAALGVRPDVILTSPYTRAAQTAELTAATLAGARSDVDHDQAGEVTEEPALASGATLDRVAPALAACAGMGDVMLVGHEPDLSGIIGMLIGGNHGAARVEMKKGACCRVDIPAGALRKAGGAPERLAGAGTLAWLLTASQLAMIGAGGQRGGGNEGGSAKWGGGAEGASDAGQ